jgi:hypothetical protein
VEQGRRPSPSGASWGLELWSPAPGPAHLLGAGCCGAAAVAPAAKRGSMLGNSRTGLWNRSATTRACLLPPGNREAGIELGLVGVRGLGPRCSLAARAGRDERAEGDERQKRATESRSEEVRPIEGSESKKSWTWAVETFLSIC